MNYWVQLGISFLSDFVITGGGTLTTAMVATKSVEMPSEAVWLLAVVFGLIAAFRRLQSITSPALAKGLPEVPQA